TSIYIPRYLARALSLTQAECRKRFRVSYVRVAEFQRRGAVHLHVIVRLDTIDGEVPNVAGELLASACGAAARAVSVSVAERSMEWGEQVDTSVLERDESRPRRLAAYVAKYATKSSESSGALDRRIHSTEDLAGRRLPAHERRLATRAWVLGSDEALEHLHLRRYAHVLGYGGHFLSKSRRYSTTFGSLRGARVAWREAHRPRQDESPDCSYEATWLAVGIGWANRGEAACAEQSREAAAYARRVARESEHDDG
ncbi:MAG: replication initiator, partial [Acidimicrobiales bacterium]